MSNPALMTADRRTRRLALEAEARARKSGKWPPWRRISNALGVPGTSGWAAELNTIYINDVFVAQERRLTDGTRHFMISSLSQIRPTWWETQRIKNDLAGPEATAIEVYPPQAEVVDGADSYHLWVLPGPLPFSLWKSR